MLFCFLLASASSASATAGHLLHNPTEPGDGHSSPSDHEHDDSGQDDPSPGGDLVLPDPFGRSKGPVLDRIPPEVEQCSIHSSTLNGGKSLREALGLGTEIDPSRANLSRLGFRVTPDEANTIDQSMKARAEYDTVAVTDLVDERQLLGVRWDAASSRMSVFVTSTTEVGADQLQAAITRQLATPNPIDVVVVEAGLNAIQIDAIQDQMMAAISELETQGSVKSTVDITCGKILVVVETREDLEGVAKVAQQWEGTAVVVLSPAHASRPATRYDHHHDNQDGGLVYEIIDESLGWAPGNCTASIPFRSSGGSGEYAITAAHCMGDDNLVESTTRQWACDVRVRQGGIYISSGSNCARYQLGGRVDAIAKWKYSNEGGGPEHIWHGGTHTSVPMDAWLWARNQLTVGDFVCHSGLNWGGINCGNVDDFNFDACWPALPPAYPAYCVDDLVDSSMVGYPGDSGGTVWQHKNGNFYTGIITESGGAFTHIQDMRASLGLGAPVGF